MDIRVMLLRAVKYEIMKVRVNFGYKLANSPL